jgi:heptosyltransferase-2
MLQLCMAVSQCRHFSGYKPCAKSSSCDDGCLHKDIPRLNVLLIHLGALGAVVRSTSLLASIHRKYPGCRLIWVTEAPAHTLLRGHPLVDVVYSTSESDLLELASWDFEVALVIDKSRKAAGILRRVTFDQIFGFEVSPQSGAVLPATVAATELWEIGLSNHKKFFQNTKSESQLIHEALELGAWTRGDYNLPLSSSEQKISSERRQQWTADPGQPLIGINTGASPTIPYKKWTVAYQRELIVKLQARHGGNIVLLGGPEDTERNAQIAEGLNVAQSPTTAGLRDGLLSVDACDLVFTGDSLGMHMAIARKKFVIAWFGPTCAQEIDLFERGVKVLAKVPCGPCWKRVCDQAVMCYDQVDFKELFSALEKGIQFWEKSPSSSSKPPFLETSF